MGKQERLLNLEGQVLAVLGICQAIALETGKLPEIAARARQIREITQSRLLASNSSDDALAGFEKVMEKFLDIGR